MRLGEVHELFGEADAELRAEVEILDARAFRAAVMQGEVGLGDAYLLGWWRTDNLPDLVRITVRNLAEMDRAGGWLSILGKAFNRVRHLRRDNDVVGSRENISAHYDLGNDFYRLWLDPTLAYSCAIFAEPGECLASAQTRKFETLCQKLQLKPGEHLLEIGTGWGGFALHAVKHHGVRVTTTTISQAQFDYAQALFEREGVADRIDLRFEDYRHLTGSYDKAVSIEMFEAVGLKHYDTYFGTVDRLLAPGGVFLVQTITMNEGRFPEYIRSSDWIQRRIFPGAELSSISEVLRSLGRCTSLNLFHLEEFGRHYALTLRRWREAFLEHLDAVRALGYDDRFIRMWEYYLASCEGAFQERYIGVSHLHLVKRGCDRRLPNEVA
ncbi:MAG TPA: cyclopropane-fatty-acyl-phospholipid synthase family protein [Holophagaceae bacterium]|nr:cyclopropane-fatty-acyl-phospholipid synthase family protein [Holophagaceae bacterium]